MPTNKSQGHSGKAPSSPKGKQGGFSGIAVPGTVPVMKANRAEAGKVDTKGKWGFWSDGQSAFKG